MTEGAQEIPRIITDVEKVDDENDLSSVHDTDVLIKTINGLREDNKKLREKNDTCENKIQALAKQVERLKKQTDEYKRRIANLKRRLEKWRR